jgi:hypothetical protein
VMAYQLTHQGSMPNYLFSYFSRERRVTLEANLENASSRHANGEYVIAQALTCNAKPSKPGTIIQTY